MWLKWQQKETAVLGHVSHTDIHTKNGIVWTAARHRTECHPYLEKSKFNCCWRLARFTYYKRRRNNKEWGKKRKNIKYSYMAGSRQHLSWSFMRACLRCLTLVDTDVLLQCMYLLLLLLWWCIAVGCGVATTAAVVHEETEETYK